MRRAPALAALAALAVAAPGCGEDPDARFSLKTPPVHRGAEPVEPSEHAAASGRRARRPTQRDAERLRPLIKAWADALRRGDVERAAEFFAVPAIVAQTDTVRLQTRQDVLTFNAGLPCGARLLEVQHDGRYIVGTFRLTRRPGKDCLAAGQLARVAFVIEGRKFTEWRQVPDTPGAAPGPDEPEDPETLPTPGGETA